MGARRNRSPRGSKPTLRATQNQADSPTPTHRGKYAFAIKAGLVAITAAIYATVYSFGFVNWDDPLLVVDNPHIVDGLTWAAVRWASTAIYFGDWHPITWLSHLIDAQLFGITPGPHHLTSVILHAINACILFDLLVAVTGATWRSALVSALFAIHPLHVESTAWISARSDVLSTAFWLLALRAYAAYVVRPRRRAYLLFVTLFVLGLMAKPMLVTLPATLLLLDIWPLERIRFDEPSTWLSALREKAALFLLSVVVAVVTVLGRTGEVPPSITGTLPLGFRLANAVQSYVAYVAKTVWPAGLTIVYPYPNSFEPAAVVGTVILLVGITWFAWRTRRTHPYVLFGWAFFVVTLLPVSGVIQIGDESHADRYMYVPAIGLFVAGVWGLAHAVPLSLRRAVLPVLGATAIVGYAVTARVQLEHWRNSETLWSHALAVTTNNARAHNNLGNVLQESGRNSEAQAQYEEALRIRPTFADAHANLGNALVAQGKAEDAVTHYNDALSLRPNFANAHNSLGSALDDLGRLDEAVSHLHQALRLDPGLAAAHNNLAAVLVKQGKLEEATSELEAAIRSQPADLEYRLNHAMVLKARGRTQEAASAVEALLKISPNHQAARQLRASLQQP